MWLLVCHAGSVPWGCACWFMCYSAAVASQHLDIVHVAGLLTVACVGVRYWFAFRSFDLNAHVRCFTEIGFGCHTSLPFASFVCIHSGSWRGRWEGGGARTHP